MIAISDWNILVNSCHDVLVNKYVLTNCDVIVMKTIYDVSMKHAQNINLIPTRPLHKKQTTKKNSWHPMQSNHAFMGVSTQTRTKHTNGQLKLSNGSVTPTFHSFPRLQLVKFDLGD